MFIPRFSLENIGSLQKIEFVPAFGIQTFSPTSAGTIAAGSLVLRAGFAWASIYCPEDTMGHQQDQVNSDQGESWVQQVLGFVPGDELAIDAGLRSLANTLHVLRITLKNGTVKIVGNPVEGLQAKLKSNTQDSVPGRPGTAISFTGDTTVRALFLTA